MVQCIFFFFIRAEYFNGAYPLRWENVAPQLCEEATDLSDSMKVVVVTASPFARPPWLHNKYATATDVLN